MKKAACFLVYLILIIALASCALNINIPEEDSSFLPSESIFVSYISEISGEAPSEESVFAENSVIYNESVYKEESMFAAESFNVEVSEGYLEREESTVTVLDSLTANHIFVYDVGEGEYLFTKNTDVNIMPASITKLLTALYALEVAPAALIITPSDELYLLNPYSSVAGISFEHTFTLEQLVAAMLLPSGNDAAYTVAAAVARYKTGKSDMAGREAVELFISELNLYAEYIGCTGTVFTVPDGLAGSEHYTTADDLVIIAKHALANPMISKYISIPEYSFTSVSGHSFSWRNTNAHLDTASPYFSSFVTGMKTGTLGLYSIMVSADINGNTYIIGVFDASSHDARYRESLKIIEYIVEYHK